MHPLIPSRLDKWDADPRDEVEALLRPRLLAQRELSPVSQYRSNCFSPADQLAVLGAGPVTMAPMPQACPGDDACVLKRRPSPRRP